MKKALMSFGTGTHKRYIDIARPLFEKYAGLHGYDYIEPEFTDYGRPPSWCKVACMLNIIDDYDVIQWIDADVIIVDGSKDLADDVPDWAMQAVVIHETRDGEVPNFGVWFVRNAAKEFLELLWQQEQHIHAPWWEQTAALELMGYASNQRPCALVDPTLWYHKTAFLNLEWNSHPWCRAEKPRFNHATMYGDIESKMVGWVNQSDWQE